MRVAKLIYAASETCADLLYASNFPAPDPFLWFTIGTETFLIVSALEIGRARKQARRGLTVLSLPEARARWQVPDKTKDGMATALIAAVTRTEDVNEWQVPNDFPLSLARKLEEHSLRLTPQDELFPERRRKQPDEIEKIRQGVELAEAGLAVALDILRDARTDADGHLTWQGTILTAERLRGAIGAAIAGLGGTAAHTITAPGPQGADPHQPGTGPIRAGEPIVIDIFPRVDATGYHGDLTRTVVKGKAQPIVTRAFTAVHEAQRAAIRQVKAGVKASVVHAAAAAVLAKHGFRTNANAAVPYGFFHGTGHGLGLQVHEAPRVNEKSDDILESGNIVTIEPGLYYPEWGGIRLEDVVAVRQEDAENLTRADIFLEIP